MTREELMVFYAAVIRTPADKVAAGAQLSKMTGWNQPEQIQIGGADSLKII
ncbi:MAG: hypothetical protein ABW172_03140 [Candidatus Binatia bacterium]